MAAVAGHVVAIVALFGSILAPVAADRRTGQARIVEYVTIVNTTALLLRRA
jgi:hypothetical protein